MFRNKRNVFIAATLLACVFDAEFAVAQKKADSYPTKPIRLIVPFAEGGAPGLVSRRPVCGNGDVAPGNPMRRTAPVSAPRTKAFRREPGATGQNSCQPEGLQPESAAHRSVEQGPHSWGCDRGGGRESRGFGALLVALRGRIQARSAWNLLRPPRDAALRVLPIH